MKSCNCNLDELNHRARDGDAYQSGIRGLPLHSRAWSVKRRPVVDEITGESSKVVSIPGLVAAGEAYPTSQPSADLTRRRHRRCCAFRSLSRTLLRSKRYKISPPAGLPRTRKLAPFKTLVPISLACGHCSQVRWAAAVRLCWAGSQTSRLVGPLVPWRLCWAALHQHSGSLGHLLLLICFLIFPSFPFSVHVPLIFAPCSFIIFLYCPITFLRCLSISFLFLWFPLIFLHVLGFLFLVFADDPASGCCFPGMLIFQANFVVHGHFHVGILRAYLRCPAQRENTHFWLSVRRCIVWPPLKL